MKGKRRWCEDEEGAAAQVWKRGVKDFGVRALQRTRSCALKPSVIRFFFFSSHKHHNISSVYLCLLLWLSVWEILTLKKTKAGRTVHIFMLLRERHDAMASYRTRVIFLCVHIFLALDKQLHHFMLNQETQASLLLLQINESLLFLFFSLNFF